MTKTTSGAWVDALIQRASDAQLKQLANYFASNRSVIEVLLVQDSERDDASRASPFLYTIR